MKKGIKEQSRRAIHTIDMFASPISLRADSKEQVTTWFGSFLSVLLVVIVSYYSLVKYRDLINFRDTKYQEVEIEDDDYPTFDGGDVRNFPVGMFEIKLQNGG